MDKCGILTSPVARPSAVARCSTVSSLTGQSGSSALMFFRPPSSCSSCRVTEEEERVWTTWHPPHVIHNNYDRCRCETFVISYWQTPSKTTGGPSLLWFHCTDLVYSNSRFIVLPQLIPVAQSITNATKQHGGFVVLHCHRSAWTNRLLGPHYIFVVSSWTMSTRCNTRKFCTQFCTVVYAAFQMFPNTFVGTLHISTMKTCFEWVIY